MPAMRAPVGDSVSSGAHELQQMPASPRHCVAAPAVEPKRRHVW